jgi:hypothetical protein
MQFYVFIFVRSSGTAMRTFVELVLAAFAAPLMLVVPPVFHIGRSIFERYFRQRTQRYDGLKPRGTGQKPKGTCYIFSRTAFLFAEELAIFTLASLFELVVFATCGFFGIAISALLLILPWPTEIAKTWQDRRRALLRRRRKKSRTPIEPDGKRE